MDHSSNPPSSTDQGGASSFPGEYWAGMSSLYGADTPQDQPFGIDWDHPVFQNSGNTSTHPQQGQDLYSQQPQQHQYPPPHSQHEWQQHSLQPQLLSEQQQQRYAVPPQYQVNQYPSADSRFEPSRQEHPTYHPYPFDDSNYYPNPQVQPQQQPQNGIGQPQAANVQRVGHQPQMTSDSLQNQLPAYARQPALQRSLPSDSMAVPDSYQTSRQGPAYQGMIDPRFLSPAAQSMVPPGQGENEYFSISPADFENSLNNRLYQPYKDDNQQRFITPGQELNVVPPMYQQVDPSKMRKNGLQTTTQVGTAPRVKLVQDNSKPKQARTKKSATTKRAGSASSADSDSTDVSSDLEIVGDEPSPIAATRPTDPEGAIRYDTLRVVWLPKRKKPSITAIRNAMAKFADLVKGLRDTWKSRSEALKAAENKNLEARIPAIKKDVVAQRRLLNLLVSTTIESGHPSYVQRFGEHPIIVSAFYSFLLDRHTAADSDGFLTVSILKLMAKFTTMDQAMLEKTKNDKILNRFVKKGGTVIKNLARTILNNAAEATKRKLENPKAAAQNDLIVAPTPPSAAAAPNSSEPSLRHVVIRTPSTEPVAGTKRPRESEGHEPPPTKRTVTPSNGKPTGAASKPAAAGVGPTKKVPASAQDKQSAQNSAAAAPKPKANIVAPKPPPSLFSNLMSASKKPGTSNAARAAAAAAAKEKASATSDTKEQKPAPAAATPKPVAFSFSETMADLNKPKEATPTKSVEETPPESEEERAKWLRKKERRKLRVSWKPDDSLTEVRLFTHDPEEEIGHDESMIRDVADVGGEGRMLKLHRGLVDLEDEDEGDEDEGMIAYKSPVEIDFTHFNAEDRGRNFIKSGGTQEPDSRERAAQDQREANTLSVFYTNPADIPISPKEPPPVDDESYSPEVPFGEPNDMTRDRSAKYFAARAPPPPPPPQQAQPAATNPGQVDIASLLRIIQQAPQQQQQAIQPQQPNMPDLESTFNQFRNQGQAPIPTVPQAAAPPTGQQQGLDLQKILALMNPQNQMQQPQLFPQAQTQNAQAPNLASILSQFTNSATSQQQPSSSSYEFGGQRGQNSYYDEDRKRGHGGHNDGYGEGYNKRPKMNGDSRSKKHPKHGLVPCRFWAEGKCIKGDSCTFRHDPLD